jgi:hypothetical protein
MSVVEVLSAVKLALTEVIVDWARLTDPEIKAILAAVLVIALAAIVPLAEMLLGGVDAGARTVWV